MKSERDHRTLIGHLIEVTGAEFVAQLISEDEGFIPEETIGKDVEIRVGQIGSYLMVRQTGIPIAGHRGKHVAGNRPGEACECCGSTRSGKLTAKGEI